MTRFAFVALALAAGGCAVSSAELDARYAAALTACCYPLALAECPSHPALAAQRERSEPWEGTCPQPR